MEIIRFEYSDHGDFFSQFFFNITLTVFFFQYKGKEEEISQQSIGRFSPFVHNIDVSI